MPFHAAAAQVDGAARVQLDIVRNWDERKQELDETLYTTLEFGLKVAYEPYGVEDEDLDALRNLGYSDDDIIELTAAALLGFKLSAFARVLDLSK